MLEMRDKRDKQSSGKVEKQFKMLEIESEVTSAVLD